MAAGGDPRPLAGRAALITGASRGIGRAIALQLHADGARVALCARSRLPLESLAQDTGGVAIPLDLSDSSAGSRAVEAAEAALGPLHILVHAAAPVFPMQRVMQLADEDISSGLGSSIAAMAGMCRAAVPSMLGHRFGRIITVGSLAASHGAAGSAIYAAGKAGLDGLMRALAVDHGRHGVTANTVAVSFCDTERFRDRTTEETRRRFTEATALRRIPTPQDVARVVAWLCRDDAGIITGSVVEATAGAHLNTLW